VRAGWKSFGTLVLCLIVVSSGLAVADDDGWPEPVDSTPRHQVGYWNTTFVDSGTNSINVTIFYPAQTDGEETSQDSSHAPYPVLCIVPFDGVSPAYTYYGSYGEHLARRGYIVSMVELAPYDQADPIDHWKMANVTLESLDLLVTEDARTGSNLEGMVNESAMALAGHGISGKTALLAAIEDGGTLVKGVACLDLWDPAVGPQPSKETGRLGVPLLLIESQIDAVQTRMYSRDAFNGKAEGYVSLLELNDTNFNQFFDETPPPPYSHFEAPVTTSRQDQHNLTNEYLLAFVDRHLKADMVAGDKLYGAQARAALESRILSNWRYGVLDLSVEIDLPSDGVTLPPGTVAFCATVSNVGPFPMPPRNVTLEVARIVPGGTRAFVMVYGPVNRTTGAFIIGGHLDVSWTPLLTEYGNYQAWVKMNDPDHNVTNDKVTIGFTLSPLLPPTIDHTPPEAIELGQPHNLTFRLGAPTSIQQAYINFSDELGIPLIMDLVEDPTSGEWYTGIPAPMSVGEVSYKVHVQAGNGAWNITNRFYIPVEDTTPPVIDHTRPAEQLPVLASVEFNATIFDFGDVSEVRLLYTDPSTGFRNVSCGRDGDRWFYPVVLGAKEGILEYTWYARDSWGNVATLGPLEITLVDSSAPVIVPQTAADVELGEAAALSADVTDDSALASVWVLYRMPGDVEDTNSTPIFIGGMWRLTLPQAADPGNITYSWWAVDSNGKVASSGDLFITVIDSAPPLIDVIRTGDTAVGKEPYVEAEIYDSGGVLGAQVYYTDIQGVDGSVAMEEVSPNLWVASLPDQPKGGAMTFYVEAHDISGNSVTSSDRTMVVQDLDPPVMVHQMPEELLEGQEVDFIVHVTDNVAVEHVVLYLKLTPQGSFRRLEMTMGSEGLYSYTLHGDEVSPPEIMYYFEAEDIPPSSNVVYDPPGAPQLVYHGNVTQVPITLFGVVTGRGGDPLKGATVEVLGLNIVTTTDKDGSYSLDELHTGSYSIRVSAKGHKEVDIDLVLTVAGGDREQDVSLAPIERTGEDDGLPFAVVLGIIIIAAALVLVAFVLLTARR
jgi:hypothetical protein